MCRNWGSAQLIELRNCARQPLSVKAHEANRMQLDAETSHDLGKARGLFSFRILLVIAECVPIRYVLALRSAEASLDEAALDGVATAFESCKRFDLFLAQFQDGRRRQLGLQVQTGKFHEQRRVVRTPAI